MTNELIASVTILVLSGMFFTLSGWVVWTELNREIRNRGLLVSIWAANTLIAVITPMAFHSLQ